ncbi:2'-5'-oligoadenylate synthase 1A-like [Asterias amurensis]|uniref:2'-5'-oligoadenylate synthase 1A-like n=1 Tax=Asterias amurensis TaxID=7602 RepID=UPI003AB3ED96
MASWGNQEEEEPMRGSRLFAGPVGKKPSARGNGLDFEIEVEEEPWCLSPDELETWYHAGNKNMQHGTELFAHDCISLIKSLLKGIRDSTRHSDTLGFTNTVVQGGSFGKGTMVKNLSDVDLVLFVNNPPLQPITETGNLKEYKRALPNIISHLGSNVGGPRGLQPDLRLEKHLVNFKTYVRDRLVEFNLLPTTEQNVEHFRDTDRNTFLSMLDVGHETRAFLSASFVEHQVRFVGNQPKDVKELICLVKYWASRFLPEKLQKSYPLELITIDRWEKAEKAEQPGRRLRRRRLNKAQGLKSVLEVLTNLNRPPTYWSYMPGVDDQLNETIITKLNMERPIILDPANPTNNVGGLYRGNNKKVIKDAAERTLRRTALLGNVREWPTI